MSDYIPDQQKILEQIADEENISFLRAESAGADETPSFCELVSQGQYDRFIYAHPKDTHDMKYSAAANFLLREKSLSVVFAMAIGHGNFRQLLEQKFLRKQNKRNICFMKN